MNHTSCRHARRRSPSAVAASRGSAPRALALLFFALPALAVLGACSGSRPHTRNPASSWPLDESRVQHKSFINWVAKKENDIHAAGDAPWTKVHHIPASTRAVDLQVPETFDAEQALRTTDLYFQIFGRDSLKSFLWTGIETANPRTMNLDYRWNSLEDEGMYDHDKRMKLVNELKSRGIWNIRLGMSNHEIVRLPDGSWDEKSWKNTDDILNDFHQGGLRISLDLHHFGIEDRFRTPEDASLPINHEKSYYLNPAWPAYFADFALEAYKRYNDRIEAITIINEPDTTMGFNAQMWHGGFPGWTPKAMPWHIERAIQIGRAAIQARTKIETYIQSQSGQSSRPRVIFLHSEAAQSKPDDPVFVNYLRFMTSDMILGQTWLFSEELATLASNPSPSQGVDFAALEKKPIRTSLDWLIHASVFNGRAGTAAWKYDRIVKALNEVRNLHLELKRQTGLTMRDYTVLGIDYYMPNESYLSEALANVVKDKKKPVVTPKPAPAPAPAPSPTLSRRERHWWKRIFRRPHRRKGHENDYSEKSLAAAPLKSDAPSASEAASPAADDEPAAPAVVRRMRHEPQFYAEDIRSGIRRGMHAVFMDYWNRYPLPTMVTETGTPYFHYGDLWFQQMLLDCGAVAKSGIPFLGFTLYPTIDNFGWDAGKAMSRPKSESPEPVPAGLLDLTMEPKGYLEPFIRELKTVFPET